MKIAALVVSTLALCPVAQAHPEDLPGDHELAFAVGRPGRLGLQVQPLTEELRKFFGAPGEAGLLVGHVSTDGPGGKAGVKVGDVLVEVAGKKIEDLEDIFEAVGEKEKGTKVDLSLERDRRTVKVTVTLDAKPAWGRRAFRHYRGPGDPMIDGRVEKEIERATRGLEGFDGSRKRIDELEKRIEKLEKGKK